ncbi:MAG: recombinase family protein [Dehalococcoidia bacterium]|nr:MAG: recombinase family protein [Dehalococcoidia bacterium]
MKAIIYVRTSTTEQTPENQIAACKQFALSRGYEVVDVFMEQLSGYKDIERPKYNEIKERAYVGEIQAVIVWALDRWVRNRDTLLEDVTMLRNYNVKLHSVQESWLEAVNIEGSLGKTIQEFLLGLIGSLGEMESQRKSERVKIAYIKHKQENRKYKKWGRRSLPPRVVNEVLELYNNGVSMRKISKQVFYLDKNKNSKNLSLGAVHKIITQKKE